MRRTLEFIAVYIVLTSFVFMTADVIKNPTQYDTVAQYHATLE